MGGYRAGAEGGVPGFTDFSESLFSVICWVRTEKIVFFWRLSSREEHCRVPELMFAGRVVRDDGMVRLEYGMESEERGAFLAIILFVLCKLWGFLRRLPGFATGGLGFKAKKGRFAGYRLR
jgi:hypothetical protein